MPERCWTVFRALRSAVSMARALPFQPHQVGPRGALAFLDEDIDSHVRIERAEERFGHGRPATSIASRASMTPEKRAYRPG